MSGTNELRVADGMPSSLGRKTGCTAKEFRRALDDYLKRKKMTSYKFGIPKRNQGKKKAR